MSKHKLYTPTAAEEAVFNSVPSGPGIMVLALAKQPDSPAAIAAAPPVPVPVQVPVGECLGKMVECPICGKPAYVDHARGARTLTQVISSKFWVMLTCKGYCGKALCKTITEVTPLAEPIPEPVWKSLGEAVGGFVRCPKCSGKARAAWTLDDAHVIQCGQCGQRAYPSEETVEVVV
jgi:hypothetical protein